ncbi:MAG: NADH-quinone oxidoreductase subunit M, partial [Cocleimonas sp.]|nr:NADH-quinone oxidoreductase subunit M [Cocleimonas sp.]
MTLQTADFSWLSFLILLLPLGAAITLLIPSREARWTALTINLIAFITALTIAIGFDSSLSGFQYVEKYDWISGLNIHYFLGIDGLSVLFLPATTLLFTGIILASWNSITKLRNLYFALILILECAVLGVFVALDTIVFILFWEITLIPLFFLISLWGVGANRRYAGMKYVLFMMGGGLPLLFAFVLLAVGGESGHYIFDYTELVKVARENEYQTIIFFLLLFGFGVKTPLFPLHTWLPVLAQEGHPA